MRDYYKEFCSNCKHKDVDEHDSPCKECIDAFFDDWKKPKRKFGKYFDIAEKLIDVEEEIENDTTHNNG